MTFLFFNGDSFLTRVHMCTLLFIISCAPLGAYFCIARDALLKSPSRNDFLTN